MDEQAYLCVCRSLTQKEQEEEEEDEAWGWMGNDVIAPLLRQMMMLGGLEIAAGLSQGSGFIVEN